MRRLLTLLTLVAVLLTALGSYGPTGAQDLLAETEEGAPAEEPAEPEPIADRDGDGAADDADNCPDTPNADQSDRDGNGVGDACDAPPPPPDADGDGVPDDADNCPETGNGDQSDRDANGIGDACDAPPATEPTTEPTDVPAPTEPSVEPTEEPTATPTPRATPTPVLTGPDDASLFGWPSSVGGTPLYLAPEIAAKYGEREVIARINSGGPELKTADGAVWAADENYKGGKAFRRRNQTEIAGTDDDALFRTERRSRKPGGNIRYTLDVPEPGVYTVRFYVGALTYPDATDDADDTIDYSIGERVMTVNLEGGEAEAVDWDVYATGEPIEMAVRSFDVEVTDGTLNILIDGSVGRSALAALEVLGPERSAGAAMVEFAMQYVGYPYIWATHGPDSFDCSGFTDWIALNVLGVHIGYNQVEQLAYGVAIAPGDLQPGDLVFFQNTHPVHEGVSHVGMYIGNGQFIHASTNTTGVVVSDLTWGYYADHYFGAVRLV